MPTGTIQRVFQIDRANKKPGAVVFSDGQKFSTFDPAPIKAATGNEGQLAEYTTEQSGQYTNLKTLRVFGAGNGNTGSGNAQPARDIVDLGTKQLTEATKDVAAAVRELTAALKGRPAVAGTAPAAPAPAPGDDALASLQAKLAEAVEADPAQAMFDALRKKHKKPDALLAAAKELLKVHGIEAE